MSVELLPIERELEVSDFLTIHLPKTPETMGLSAGLLAGPSPGCAS